VHHLASSESAIHSGLSHSLLGPLHRWGFNNVHMKEGDEWKVAFRTNCGLFEPLVMFFGLTNSPATFQTMMNDIFRDLIAEGVVVVYLDDILIFTETVKQHREVTRRVLKLLEENQLFLKLDKCEFEKTKVEYLGVIISHNSVEMDPVKIAGVTEWPTPTSKKEVQSFLGFTNFYQRFIRDFSHHARPLFDLTKNDGKSMGKSDALSRRADHGMGSDDNANIVLLTPKLFAVRALEGLETFGEEQNLLRDVRRGVRDTEPENAVSKVVKDLKATRSRSVRSAEWNLTDGVLYFRGKIYVPDLDLRRQIVSLYHDTRVARHSGRWKTLELVSRNYWWPQMSRYIGKYTSTCDLCIRTKTQRHQPVGELRPLPVPDAPWDTV
jgi:hypothetical protein